MAWRSRGEEPRVLLVQGAEVSAKKGWAISPAFLSRTNPSLTTGPGQNSPGGFLPRTPTLPQFSASVNT